MPLIKEGLYDDLPFKFAAVEEFTEKGQKGYLALFNFDKDRYGYDRIPNDFLLSVFGIVEQKMLDTLKQGAVYYLKGEVLFLRRINFSCIKKYLTMVLLELYRFQM